MELFDIVLSLIVLIVLEIILGIDNLVFLTILTEKLPKVQRKRARQWGLTFAWVTRLILLASAVWLVKLTRPLFSLGELSFSLRDLFLIGGGAFLIAKATQEIHDEVGEDFSDEEEFSKSLATFRSVVMQVVLMDVVFSFDSVLTAVGLTSIYWVMALAITIAILVMLYANEIVSQFIEKHPTIKMLVLTFLILIGTVLIADGFSFHIPRGYVYFAMGFSLSVESLNFFKRTRRRKRKPIRKPTTKR